MKLRQETAGGGPVAGVRAPGLARVELWLLVVVAGVTGGWATATPRGFYDHFPGFGHHWVSALPPYNEHLVRDVGVSALPPYNEHLVRDVGAFYLGFAVLIAAAAILLERRLVIASMLALLVTQVPHLIFHLNHLEGLSTSDQVGQVAGLALAVLLSLLVLVQAAWPGTGPRRSGR